ncbi:ribosomal protein S6 kinase-like 1 [Fundulus heteroclitus]|uniref:ribosomal protein S6 kinase-like 1 n=1 Tax=Fundulus heteroclitus TaxID=8078 RepID=UPI00165AB616|nr:ribosomal protein S6 kinase-like 1 [Fundulus heteroclitus]XP_012707096.2 ribosomal protein S6 kinase-like 1 [Fundulus heteroclitus]
MAKRDYLVEAAKQIRMALDSEVNEDYEAAFSYYKNGVDLLLNGVQLDPNKDRREAVKRKTTQYLKRAEEIFITHLQDNLGKGGSHLGGYSSLRFRPIRHLSSPVEDLEMCKVVGVSDKVLIVQSMVNKETFVVKSLVKSSWESRDQTTIIPQGVPYMVKLLRYYVSEDAVYLHLEHVKGRRLFSKLQKLRNEKAGEHPGPRFSHGQQNVTLRTSHTSPAISTEYQHGSRSPAATPHRLTDESPEADFPNSWDETQQRLESWGTHSYIEETGCLQNTRSAASFYTKLDQMTLLSGLTRTQVGTQIHPPAPSLCLHSSKAQEKPALPLSCTRVSQALDVMSELNKKKAGTGLIECSTDFEAAWEAADPTHSYVKTNPYAVTGNNLQRATPQTSQTSLKSAEPPQSQDDALSSSPAILHLPLHCQTQIRGRASWDTNGSHQGSFLGGSSEEIPAAPREESSPVVEERNGMIVIRSTDRAVFSDHTDTNVVSESSRDFPASLFHGGAKTPGTLSEACHHRERCAKGEKQAVEVACEARSPGGKASKGGSYVGWFSPDPLGAASHGDRKNEEGPERRGQDQIIEVDGWCHLPRVPAMTSGGSADKAPQGCWGLPEAEVRVWGAQILLALESLHEQGILCRDLNPRNILLTSNGKVCLTFFSQWSEVQSEISSKAMEQMYCAPEIGGVSRITEACDWWSLGALLFELLTGMPLWQLHPAGIHSHTQLLIPDHLSAAAASLLTELLQFDAGYRLGSGGGGVSDIKCHPFFSSVSWKALSC